MGADIKAIRARIKSVDSTKHITKAMQLVASSKIKKASNKMEASRFYRQVMLDAFADLSAEKSRYSVQRDRSLPVLYIIIAGDRGLAGGYNNNIFRSSGTVLRDNDLILPIGKRAVEYYSRRAKVITDKFTSVERFDSVCSAEVARLVRGMYDEEKISAVCLVYTRFESMLSQSPEMIHLLPLGKDESGVMVGEKSHALVEYEPSAEEVLAAVIPEYISGVLYSAAAESYASELAARRNAMDTATKNADEMLDELSLSYNRARQGAITQEITEIVAGANA